MFDICANPKSWSFFSTKCSTLLRIICMQLTVVFFCLCDGRLVIIVNKQKVEAFFSRVHLRCFLGSQQVDILLFVLEAYLKFSEDEALFDFKKISRNND